MNLQELEAATEKLTDAQKQEILGMEFDAELEKEASDEVAESDLQNALYAYGMFKADVEVEAEEAGEDGLSKEASEQFEAAETEISAAIEAGVEELGLADIEDEAELHKTAMACAGIIFEGYSDQMEKWAAKSKKDGKGLKGMYGNMKKKVGALGEKAKGLAAKGHKLVKKHPGKAGAIAAGGLALGYGAKKLMDKKASDLSASELIDLTLEKQATVEVVVEGIEKLAARGAAKAGLASKAMGHVKSLHKKHLAGHGKQMAGAGAAGAGAGYLAHRMQKKDK